LSKQTYRAVVGSIQIFHKRASEGLAGDIVGLRLRGIESTQLKRGQVLAAPGSITPLHTKFEAQVYVLSADECGRRWPFFTGYRPQFYFRTARVTGAITLPPGTEMGLPGCNVGLTVELLDSSPIPLEEGQRFVVREGGRCVATGCVTRILE
jgi:elongation factor Tu